MREFHFDIFLDRVGASAPTTMMRKTFILLIFAAILSFPAALFAKEWDPRLLQASRLAFQGNIPKAETTLESYLQDHPEDPNGLFVEAVILDWKTALTGQPEAPAHRRMLEIYKEANNLAFQNWYRDPENVDRLIDLGNSYLFLGRKYYDVGFSLRAVLTAKKCQRHLEKALKLDPSRVDGLLALGGFHYFAAQAPAGLAFFKKLFGIRGTREQGLAELREAQGGIYPFALQTRYALIYVYTDYEKNYEEALKLLNALEAEFPENPAIRYKRPMIYEKQDPAKGVEGYLSFAEWCEAKKGICHSNYLFLAYYHAGRLLRDLGRSTQAKEMFSRALLNDVRLYPELTATAAAAKTEGIP